MKMMKIFCGWILIGFLSLSTAMSQNVNPLPEEAIQNNTDVDVEEEVAYQPFHVGLQVKNMHLWRGYKVTTAAMTGVDVHYASRNGKFSAGIWGGAGFTGEYKEFDYYLSYKFGAFNLAIWDINNFTGRESAKIFDYNPATTSHFIDVTLSYDFPTIPNLKASWSTIIAGRDFYVNENEEVINRFSNYVALEYQIYQNETVSLHLMAGGAFALGRQDHFYGAKPNLVNLGMIAKKTIEIAGYQLPVAATGMWNPEQNYGALEIAVNVF